MEKLKIVGWTNFECEYPSKNAEGPEFREIMQLIGDEVVKHGYSFSGHDHQFASTGVPVFSDGTCLRASMRSWGYIMAAIHSEIEGINLSYMDFYMDTFRDKVLPEYEEVDIKPGYVEGERPGMIVEEDVNLITQSVSAGIELMTFDKVLNFYVELLKKQQE